MTVTQEPLSPRREGSGTWSKVLFWGWNVVFLAVMLLGFAPQQLPDLIKSVRDGVTPVIYLVYSLVLISIPIVATLIGIFVLRKKPEKLFALGYVVEWPLLLILAFRFFVINEGNPAITVLLVWLAIAEAIFLWYLLDEKIDTRPNIWRHLRLAGLTLLFSGTIYAAAWLAFYIPPLAVILYEAVRNLFLFFGDVTRSLSSLRWYDIPLTILSQLLAFFSGALILIMPVAAPIIAGRAWLNSLRSTQKVSGRVASLSISFVPLALVLVALAVSMQQPQKTAFALLKEPPATPEQAQALIDRKDQIRAGLLNTYLASFRYISSDGDVRHINEIYQWTLKLKQESAWRVQLAYEVFLRPFLYTPVYPVNASTPNGQTLRTEQTEAAVLYQHFFDTPINKGERETIVNAVRSTSNVNQAELAWQAVDDREVHLNRQEVTITEHGDWADIQIYEVYANRTFQRQEVVYYFNLPESAVVTGLWLGNNPDRSVAFPYVVAPRGAAQAVYRNEIQYQRDPALLEQIGPRQYRLRAFPVEPQNWRGTSISTLPGPELHLWMTYRTLAVNGKWPLPQIAEKFNVFWDSQSARLINGKPIPAGETAWLPNAVAPSSPVTAVAHRVDFPDGTSVVARPALDVETAALPSNLQVAVVLDRSFSMRDRAGEVKQALDGLKQVTSSGPEPDVYLTSSVYRGEAPGKVGLASLDPDQILYFGGQNAAELVKQFEELNEGKAYDMILVLTDGTGYELGQGNISLDVPDAPLWLVHLGGGFPLGYDDPTLQAVQASGGGAASSVEEALARYAIGKDAPGLADAVDGYVWETLPTSEANAIAGEILTSTASGAADSGFTALAARRLVLAEMAKNHGSLDQLPILDQIHQLAVEQSIVTPYSSMLVLVNFNQERLLDQLNERDDRFAREVENVGQTASADPFAVTGVPEPEEWLLLILAAIALAFVARRKLVQSTSRIPTP